CWKVTTTRVTVLFLLLDAPPIWGHGERHGRGHARRRADREQQQRDQEVDERGHRLHEVEDGAHRGGHGAAPGGPDADGDAGRHRDRKSTRLNSSHVKTSYAVFCL